MLAGPEDIKGCPNRSWSGSRWSGRRRARCLPHRSVPKPQAEQLRGSILVLKTDIILSSHMM